jgi:hypothetical protein
VDERDPRRGEALKREEEQVRQALEGGGPRVPLRDDDLAAIEAAARQAWRRQVAETRSAENRSGVARGFWHGRARAAIAATLAVLTVGSFFFLTLVWRQTDDAPRTVAWVEAVDGILRQDEDDASIRLDAGDELRTGAALRADGAARASLRLSSGTVVRLDEGGRLSLRGENRLALAAGAVYVDTDGGRGVTVTVETPLATVRDVGTSFTVRLTGGEEATRVEVAVREGEVSVDRVANLGGEPFSLGAGEAATLTADGAVERRDEPGYGPGWEWVLAAAPPYAVEGESLEEFLAWVAAETGWRVAYADPALAARAGEIVLHGDIAGLRPDQAPFAVLPAANLAAAVEDGVLTVRRR